MDVQKEQEQQNRTDHVVSGFAFYSEKDARLAEQGIAGRTESRAGSVGRRDSAYPSVDELCGHQGKNVSCQKKNQTGTGRK